MWKRGNVSSGEVPSHFSFTLSLGLLVDCNQLNQVHTATYCTGVGNIRDLCTSVKKNKKNKGIILYYIIYILHSSPVCLRKVNRALLLSLVFSTIPRIPCKLSSYILLQCIPLWIIYFYTTLFHTQYVFGYITNITIICYTFSHFKECVSIVSLHSRVQVWWTLTWVWPIKDWYVMARPRNWIKRTYV